MAPSFRHSPKSRVSAANITGQACCQFVQCSLWTHGIIPGKRIIPLVDELSSGTTIRYISPQGTRLDTTALSAIRPRLLVEVGMIAGILEFFGRIRSPGGRTLQASVPTTERPDDQAERRIVAGLARGNLSLQFGDYETATDAAEHRRELIEHFIK